MCVARKTKEMVAVRRLFQKFVFVVFCFLRSRLLWISPGLLITLGISFLFFSGGSGLALLFFVYVSIFRSGLVSVCVCRIF